jgi:hypothetical protein
MVATVPPPPGGGARQVVSPSGHVTQARLAPPAPHRTPAPHVQSALSAVRQSSAQPKAAANVRIPAPHVKAALGQTGRCTAPAVQRRINPAVAPHVPVLQRGVIQRALEELDLTTEDVKNHFLQAFKTVLVAEMETLDPYSFKIKTVRTKIGKFYSKGKKHAEEHLLDHLDSQWFQWEGEELVRKDRSEIRITIIINNSPCGTDDNDCSGKLKRWAEDQRLDDFNVKLVIQAANIYKKNTQASVSGLQNLEEDDHIMDWFSPEMLLAQHGMGPGEIARKPIYVDNMRKKLNNTQDFMEKF